MTRKTIRNISVELKTADFYNHTVKIIQVFKRKNKKKQKNQDRKCLLSLVLNSPTPDSTNNNNDSLSHRLEAAIARFAPSDSVEYSAQRI